MNQIYQDNKKKNSAHAHTLPGNPIYCLKDHLRPFFKHEVTKYGQYCHLFSTIIPVPFKMVVQQDHSHHERGGRRADRGSNQSQFPLPIFRDLYKLDQWFFAKFNKPVADSHFWLLFFLVIKKILDCALSYLLVNATEKCRKGEERKRGDTSQKQLVILSPKLCQECALSG